MSPAPRSLVQGLGGSLDVVAPLRGGRSGWLKKDMQRLDLRLDLDVDLGHEVLRE